MGKHRDMIKYIVHPGHVTSKYDDERRYVSADQLMHLYNVKPFECIIVHSEKNLLGTDKTLINLYPRYHGDYKNYGKS